MPLAATTVLGIAGIVLSLPAWFYFLRGAVRLYRLIASGKPDPGHIPRINRPVRRLITLIKETVFHTELMRGLPDRLVGVVRGIYPDLQPGGRLANY